MRSRNHFVCWAAALVILFLSSASYAFPNHKLRPRQQNSITPLATSTNNFGASLLKVIGGQDNVFISPLSIYTALAMTYLGTDGNTAKELEKAFQLQSNGLNKNQLHKSFRDLLSLIKEGNDEYKLFLANGMFVQQNVNIESKYVNDIKNFYEAAIEKVDFVKGPTAAKDKINKFVADTTRNKIPEFLKEPLSSNTALALMNAVYFKGTWKTMFPKERTKDGVFHKIDNSKKTVKFMTLPDENFPYYADYDSNYKFIELPYKGDHISMLLAMPMEYGQSLDLDMNSEFLRSLKPKMRKRSIKKVVLPKFQLKYRKELKSVLQKLGIQDLFSTSADLTGIRKEGDLTVSAVIHEAIIDVNEEGSEAAGSTGVVIEFKSMNFNDFIADHPFAFYIIDNRNGLILFSGRVFDPKI